MHKGEFDELNNTTLALKGYENAIEYYKIVNKMEFGDENSKEAKDSYHATVGYAISCRETLLEKINGESNDFDCEKYTDISQNKDVYSEYQDLIENLSIEEPDLYNLDAIKNDVECNNLINDSQKINLKDYEAVSNITDRISKLLTKHQKKQKNS